MQFSPQAFSVIWQQLRDQSSSQIVPTRSTTAHHKHPTPTLCASPLEVNQTVPVLAVPGPRRGQPFATV